MKNFSILFLFSCAKSFLSAFFVLSSSNLILFSSSALYFAIAFLKIARQKYSNSRFMSIKYGNTFPLESCTFVSVLPSFFWSEYERLYLPITFFAAYKASLYCRNAPLFFRPTKSAVLHFLSGTPLKAFMQYQKISGISIPDIFCKSIADSMFFLTQMQGILDNLVFPNVFCHFVIRTVHPLILPF